MTGRADDRIELLLKRHGSLTAHRQSSWAITPQMAFRLIVAAETTSDAIREDPDLLRDDAALPPLVLAVATPEFIDRYRRCYSDLAVRLVAAEVPGSGWPHLAQCVGEEVALAHMLRVASNDHESGHAQEIFGVDLELLATDPDRDTDFELCNELTFYDRDFELLWSPALDGIDTDEFLSARMAYANLHASRWFLPFGSQGQPTAP
jgi:hypothetical protein